MPNPVTVDPAELEEARTIRASLTDVALRVGRIEFAKMALDQERQAATRDFEALELREKTLLVELTKKYGVGVLNIETGVFTPADTQK